MSLHFMKQTTDFDLGDTPIENIFINDFMPTANGTYVKVYLLGFKYANDKDPSLTVDHQTIAKHLNIPLSDVLNAWDFWGKKRVIKKHYLNEEDKTQYKVEFLSLKQLYINSNYKSKKIEVENSEFFSTSYTCSPKDLVQANQIPEVSKMFLHINEIIRRELVPNEKKKVLEWLYNYNMTTNVIVRAFMYADEQKKFKSIRNIIRFVEAIIRNWYDNKITNMDELDEYLEKTDGRYLQYNRIFKALGFYPRPPSEAEKQTIDTWLDQWNFPMNVILKACEHSKKISNPNINYFNGILHNWYKEGIKTIEDLENKNKNQEKQSQPIAKLENKSSKNRFHNFEQRTAKYSKEELEKLFRQNE
jgi:DnaD/phage-associated family protein